MKIIEVLDAKEDYFDICTGLIWNQVQYKSSPIFFSLGFLLINFKNVNLNWVAKYNGNLNWKTCKKNFIKKIFFSHQ